MEYVVGPVLALLVGMKFTHFSVQKKDEQIQELTARIEKAEKTVDIIDKETLKKMMVTVSPVAKAVKQLQEAIGVQ